MVVEASIVGIFKTVLLILGAFVLLRFLGQLMIAKRNMEEERQLNKKQRDVEAERNQKLKNFGKTSILNAKKKSPTKKEGDFIQDVDYEEMN
jgi:hypothetical protein